MSQDESRVGLLSVRRRRLTARGSQPVGPTHHVVAWCSVDGAVAPTTGARFCLARPDLHADTCQLFVETFAEVFPDRLNLLLLDNSGAHTAQRRTWPAHVRYVSLPPYCPELTPIERVWRDRKDPLAWQTFPNREALREEVGDLLRADEALALQALTSYPDLVEAIHALGS